VLRAQLDRPPTRYIRWRGVALETYDSDGTWRKEKSPDDRMWHENQFGQIQGEVIGRDVNIELVRSLPVKPSPSPVFLGQRIVLEPLDTPVLFAAHKALSLRAPVSSVSQDRLTSAIIAEGFRGRIAYSVSSDIATPAEDQLRAEPPAALPELLRRYLQVPKLDSRIEVLAHQITREEANSYDKARAIEAYLKTQFRYTLDLKPVANKDPLAEFLFDLKEGHCEYFASAMVIMLRTLGIPARIVNGFQMGELNELNNFYTVRESDAHSWVEVYFPRSEAWIEFDPTPSAGINDYSGGGLMSRLRRYADAMEVFWLDYIVTLDQDEQASLMVEIQHRLMGLKDRAQSYYVAAKDWIRQLVSDYLTPRRWSAMDTMRLMAGVLVLGAAALAGYVVIAHRKRRRLAPTGYGPWWHRLFILPTWRRRIARGNHAESAVLFYEQMLAIARRAGLIKHPGQTPVEFAAGSGFRQIVEITSLYNQVRFGGLKMEESASHRVSILIAELRQAIRNRRL
jgi:transglutaminase-like putative cysteine protease